MFIINIIGFILVLGLVILIHELGHFIMAKRAGILCHEFAIGMGPIVYSKRKGETLYSVRAIPIGGFVMMAGEEVDSEILKKGQEIRFTKNKSGKIDQIILDVENDKYQDAERITVETFDLKGKNHEPLMINEHDVSRKAHYITSKKKLQIAPYNRSFESKSLGARFLAIFSGPFMNFVLAFILFVLLAFFIGFPKETDAQGSITTVIGRVQEGTPAEGKIEVGDKLIRVDGVNVEDHWQEFTEVVAQDRGNRNLEIRLHRGDWRNHPDTTFERIDVTITPIIHIFNIGVSSHEEAGEDLIIGPVQSNTPARNAGLRGGDEITKINDQSMESWRNVVSYIENNLDKDVLSVQVLRDGSHYTFDVEPHSKEILDSQNVAPVQNTIGVAPEHEFMFLRSFSRAGGNVVDSSTMIFDTLRLLFSDAVGIGDLAGPVGIYSITTSALQQGLFTLMQWVALLSVNLGILNLLPVPALDGGRLVFLGYEAVTRRKVNKTVENYLHLIMFFLLIALILYVTYNDILRLFN